MGPVLENQKPAVVFDRARATAYDQQRAKMAAMKDALHLCVRMVLADLPAEARILCVGVGTGAELIDLAQAFPQWRFTVVEPAAPMLDICRQRAGDSGFAARCTFHQGYLGTLAPSEPFDAATSILVSHFLTQTNERRDYFSEIAARLAPGGYLVNADLASDMSTPAFKSLVEVWARMLKFSDLPDGEADKMLSSLGKKVAILAPASVEKLIASAGFAAPVPFFQTLLIHAWYSRKPLPKAN